MPLHQTRGIFSIVFSTLVAGACGGSGRSVPTDSGSIPDSGVAPDASSGKFDSGNSDSGASIDAGTCDRCDGRTGLCAATPTCSAANPCVDAQVGTAKQTVSAALTAPDCKTHNAARPSFDDGPPRKWTAAGVERAACLFAPVVSKPLPLVIYLHGATGSADAIYDATSLRQKAPSYDLTGESQRAGFILVSDQGRNMLSDNGNPAGARRDLYFRKWSEHADVAALDGLIDSLGRVPEVS
jgi:hypothetical protein